MNSPTKIMLLINYSLIKKEYMVLFIFLVLALILSLIIISASYSLTVQKPELQKLSVYECGFEPYETTQSQFDIWFCVVAILFLVFDVEIMFIIPWSTVLSKLDLLGFWSMIEFLLELTIGFFYVWYVHALDWN